MRQLLLAVPVAMLIASATVGTPTVAAQLFNGMQGPNGLSGATIEARYYADCHHRTHNHYVPEWA